MAGSIKLEADMAGKSSPRILIIDHHDSYTLNLLISLSEGLKCSSSDLLSRVVVLSHDHHLLSSVKSFQQYILPHFDALILGPGPGHPGNEQDFGPAKRIIRAVLDQEIVIPLLGICLGHQGIALACGGRVVQASSLRHGLSSHIEIARLDKNEVSLPSLFKEEEFAASGVNTEVIRYNSLTVEESSLPSELVVIAWSQDANSLSPPPTRNAYFPSDLSDDFSLHSTTSGKVIMGLQHRKLPLWGVQYHPESISSHGGEKILEAFVDNCKQFWNIESRSCASEAKKGQACARLDAWRQSLRLPEWVQRLGSPLVASSSLELPALCREKKYFKIVTRSLNCLPTYEKSYVVYERLFKSSEEAGASIWLDSSRAGDPQSRFSYLSRPSWRLSYSTSNKQVHLHGSSKCKDQSSAMFELTLPSRGSKRVVEEVHGLTTPKASRSNSPDKENDGYSNGFWTWLSAFQRSLQGRLSYESNTSCPPFQTGFVGYFDYEMKEESLTRGKDYSKRPCQRQTTTGTSDGTCPSAWFGFCDRLLAYDHEKRQWTCVVLQRLDDNDLDGEEACFVQDALREKGKNIGLSEAESSSWIQEMQEALSDIARDNKHVLEIQLPSLPPLSAADSSLTYKEKVEAARAYIAKGESYEICLTNRFTGKLPDGLKNRQNYCYSLYKSLRAKNPAPYSAFLNLGTGSSILSTSPERFMNIDRDGRVEMRPIKGTLARAGFKGGKEKHRKGKLNGDDEMSLWCQVEDEKRRSALECDPKERAENLMIVDLIRADLLSFCSPDSVKVPSLMKVESYQSVHQLVTTIVGQKDTSVPSVQAIQRCFPPGSMTGAPKVRSVEILQKLEQRPRGVYSGVLGWIGLDGAASTSVVIRTVVINGQEISVGGGGAVTYLSNAEKEWQEVIDKVYSIATLRFSVELSDKDI